MGNGRERQGQQGQDTSSCACAVHPSRSTGRFFTNMSQSLFLVSGPSLYSFLKALI